jgi:hypothetical protein
MRGDLMPRRAARGCRRLAMGRTVA